MTALYNWSTNKSYQADGINPAGNTPLLNCDRLARNYTPCLGHGKYVVVFFKGACGGLSYHSRSENIRT